MAIQIRVSPDGLREAAEQYTAVQNRMEEAMSIVNAAGVQLDEAWDGVAAAQAVDALQELRSMTREVLENMAESRESLIGIAQLFESVDSGQAVSYKLLGSMPKFTGLRPVIGMQFKFGNVRIIPEQVREVAERCRQVSTICRDVTDMLHDVLSNLQAQWEGNAADRFADRSIQLIKACMEMSEEFEEFAQKIIKVSIRYEEIDSSINF